MTPPPPLSPPQTPKPSSSMAKSLMKPSFLSDGLLFFSGAAVALLLFLTFTSFFSPIPKPLQLQIQNQPYPNHQNPNQEEDPSSSSSSDVDPTAPSFYDDSSLSYTLLDGGPSIKNWDQKRHQWLQSHPNNNPNKRKILMVTASQPGPCRNPIGDHLLLRFYKNKADYCRLHGIDLFYNSALLHPKMFSFWAKIPAVRSAMVAHPDADWIWWVDSDAAFTDMDFALPIHKYDRLSANLVLHGWPHLVYEARSWTALNAGVFLMRNCQWSLDFIDRWSIMGPQSPEYERYGEIQRSVFKDKLYRESDDQTGIAYLLYAEKEKWADKVYLENDFYFEGYWVEIANKLERIEERYMEIERKERRLRRRRAEKDAAAYGRLWDEVLEKEEGMSAGREGWRRPFVTHFTGCQPCSGDHNKQYSGENCFEGMERALNFADNQVLRAYGYRHQRLLNSSGVRPLPFDFPAGARI